MDRNGLFQKTYLSKNSSLIRTIRNTQKSIAALGAFWFFEKMHALFFRRIFVWSFKCQLQSVSNAPIEACLAFFASSACFATSASLANSASLASSACTKNSVVSFREKMVPMSQSNCRNAAAPLLEEPATKRFWGKPTQCVKLCNCKCKFLLQTSNWNRTRSILLAWFLFI